MPPFRKSATFVRFLLSEAVLDLDSEALYASIAEQRFRGIENAASEETSAGWVSPNDPSGGELRRDDLVFEDLLWLRMRIDRKRLPLAWRAIWLAAEIRARGGKRPSGREREAILADIERKVLPRILPSVQLVDVVVEPETSTVLLFSTSNAVEVECARLFRATFGAGLERADPAGLLGRAELSAAARRALEEASPLSLGSRERIASAGASAAARELEA